MVKKTLAVLSLCLCASIVFAQTPVIPVAGNSFDGGAVFVSSMAVRQSGSSTWSATASAIDNDTYTNSGNTQWLVDNFESEYDVMIDSCIWSDKGTKLLLGVDMPYILHKGQWRSLSAKCGQKINMRLLSELGGWTTIYYMKTGY